MYYKIFGICVHCEYLVEVQAVKCSRIVLVFYYFSNTHTNTNTKTDTDKDTVRIRSAQFEVFFTRIGKNFETETETDDTPTSTVVTYPRLKASRPKPAKQSPKPREGD